MIDDVQSLLDQYAQWLRDKTTLRQVKDWLEITTPYLDRHNDYLQIYAQRRDGEYLLTDDGYVLEDLELSGCKLDTPKRQALLTTTLNGFGVRDNKGRLEVLASPDNFASRKHNLIQAMLAVNDLFCLASPTVASLFYEDVEAWLDENDIRYTSKVKFTGASGYDHLFDFVIPKSRRQPERVIETINRPNRNSVEAATFAWMDTRDVRPKESRFYAFLNDTTHSVPQDALSALANYNLRPVRWSRREEVKEELAS